MAKQQGFSLIELIVILVIVSILTAVGLVGLRLNQSHRQLNDSASRLVSFYNAARDSAILNSKLIRLTLKKNQLQIEQYKGGDWQPISLNSKGDQIKLNHFIKFDASETILLYPSGRSSVFEVTLSTKDESLKIKADAMGRVETDYGDD